MFGSKGQKISKALMKETYFSDWEKNFKFEAEGQEFAKILRSLEQFVSNPPQKQTLG